jgi:hypothetical protein
MVLACDRMRLRPRCVLLPQVFESERTYHSVKSEGGDKKEGDGEKEATAVETGGRGRGRG